MGIVVSDVFVDCLDQLRNAGEYATTQAPGRDIAAIESNPQHSGPMSALIEHRQINRQTKKIKFPTNLCVTQETLSSGRYIT